MTTYRATVTVDVVRRDGTSSVLSETVTHESGDNPRFERVDAEAAIQRASGAALQRIPEGNA